LKSSTIEEPAPAPKRKESSGVKRKAEVSSKLFSEESGKIGVKITTNPAESAPKIAKLSSPPPLPEPPEPTPTTETKTVWINPSHEYWRQKNPVADQICITDVQVDLNMITIRECPTDKGFFREREIKPENVTSLS
jgi:chromobox protein 8